MGDAYQFSESSLPLLERCIRVAAQPGKEWMALFNSNTTFEKCKILKKEDSISSSVTTEVIEYEENVTDNQKEDMSRKASDETIEKIRAKLEMDSNQLDNLMNEICNYDNLLPILARKLSTACVEAICENIFFSRPSYIEKMYTEFLAVFLKEGTASGSLEMLIKAREAHSEAFKSLIVTLLTNNAPFAVLDNFFTTIGNTEQNNLLQALSMKQISSEAFIQHLNSISILYKNSQKTQEIQNFILNCLLSSAKTCTKDKNYGKFLLTYIQALKESNAPINKHELENLVKTHETPFARPCMTVLNNFK